MLSAGCAVAFASPVCPLLLSRAGDPLHDIPQRWGPTGALPHAAGRLPGAVSTITPPALGRGSPALPPGQSRSLPPALTTQGST